MEIGGRRARHAEQQFCELTFLFQLPPTNKEEYSCCSSGFKITVLTMEEIEEAPPVELTPESSAMMEGGNNIGKIQANAPMIAESPPPTTGKFGSYGTILEAAFVDPAYSWPPAEGEGRNAIELQASVSLLAKDDESVGTTESQKQRMTIPPKPRSGNGGFWGCCKSTDAVVYDLQDWKIAKQNAIEARKEHYAMKKAKSKEYRKKNRYSRVPEGIMIYRLDTSNRTLTLMSQPNPRTDTSALVQEMIIASAHPSFDKSRRGMNLKAVDGTELNLVACEQRTAISWLETMDLMLANKGRRGESVSVPILHLIDVQPNWSHLTF